jgi:hypothetical protein
MFKKSFLLLSIVAFVSQPLFAVMLTQTQYFSGSSNSNGTLTFNQFDRATGPLKSISILFYLETFGGRLILDNDSTASASGFFEFGASGSIGSNDVALLNPSYIPCLGNVKAIHKQSFSLSPDNGDGLNFDSSTPDGLSFNGHPEIASAADIIGEAFWNIGKGFLGTSSFGINYSIIQWVDYGSLASMSYAVGPVSFEGLVTLIYTYETAPEPATILFFGLAAAFVRICPKPSAKRS